MAIRQADQRQVVGLFTPEGRHSVIGSCADRDGLRLGSKPVAHAGFPYRLTLRIFRRAQRVCRERGQRLPMNDMAAEKYCENGERTYTEELLDTHVVANMYASIDGRAMGCSAAFVAHEFVVFSSWVTGNEA